MKHDRARELAATLYSGMSLEEIQEGVSAEAVSYAAGLLVEALRNYESKTLNARSEKISLTEAQMMAANLIARISAHLDDKTVKEQLGRVRHAIKEANQ